MPTIFDERFAALRAQLFTGAVPDMLFAYWGAAGGVGNATVDRMHSFLQTQMGAFPFTQLSDMWYEFLGNLGFTGSVNDRELAFWAGGGVITPPAILSSVATTTTLTITFDTALTGVTAAGYTATVNAVPATVSSVLPGLATQVVVTVSPAGLSTQAIEVTYDDALGALADVATLIKVPDFVESAVIP